jgi:hypothetical protein
VFGVVLPDQRLRGQADGGGDAADMAARVEVAAAAGEVIGLDAPDDRFPDPGLLADLGDSETGLTPSFRQRVSDAHAAPPLAFVAISPTPASAGNITQCRQQGVSAL